MFCNKLFTLKNKSKETEQKIRQEIKKERTYGEQNEERKITQTYYI